MDDADLSGDGGDYERRLADNEWRQLHDTLKKVLCDKSHIDLWPSFNVLM